MSAVRPLGPRARRQRAVRATVGRLSLRERLVLSLLLVERLRPIEVAAALRMSVRQVERTSLALREQFGRSAGRARAPRRLRRAA